MSNFTQVGFRALRTPSGEVTEVKPIYFATTPELERAEHKLRAELEELQAKALFDYIEAMKKLKDDRNGEF